MRQQVAYAEISQTLAWIWLAALVIGLVIFAIWRWWRSKHPKPKPKPERKLSYSQSLAKRLAAAGQASRSKSTHESAGASGVPLTKGRPRAAPPD